MLPKMIQIVGKEHQTNHCLRLLLLLLLFLIFLLYILFLPILLSALRLYHFLLCLLLTATYRSSSVLYMRRAGLSWELICKITGHSSTANLIKHYDTMLEAQGGWSAET